MAEASPAAGAPSGRRHVVLAHPQPELLRAVGAENLGAGVAKGYPRGSLEWLVAAGPEIVLDLSPQSEPPRSEAQPAEARGSAGSPDERERASSRALAFWSRWPSLPAVKSGRVLALDATRISLPGPELDWALRDLAVAVHGRGIEPAIERELERVRESSATPVERGTP